MPFVATPDARIYYEREGFGPRLLVISGSGSDMRFHPNALDWPLKADFEVVGYDQRGLGRSDAALPDRQPEMADFAADALALADHLGWDRFRLLGISFGGMVAQEVAIRAGRRIERLALVCTSAGGGGGSSYPLHELYQLEDEARMSRSVALIDTRTATDPKLEALLRAWTSNPQTPSTGMMRQMEARRHHDTWDRLSSLRVPTIVASGRYDGIAPPANGEALANRIKDSKLEIFEGGHAFLNQDPRAFPAVTQFLLDD